jgi:glycosyltransferase involved in cell wall biosynthesis
MEIEWRVYGTGASVPPQNGIADYIPLGFLSPRRLAEEYCKADILLSASWYESFPLFPIEAMACGLAVVTSQYGTEEYAMHEVTAEIVAPKDPESIAHGLLRLIKSPEYRCKLGKNGNMKSKEFTWERSVDRFEKLIVGGEH